MIPSTRGIDWARAADIVGSHVHPPPRRVPWTAHPQAHSRSSSSSASRVVTSSSSARARAVVVTRPRPARRRRTSSARRASAGSARRPSASSRIGSGRRWRPRCRRTPRRPSGAGSVTADPHHPPAGHPGCRPKAFSKTPWTRPRGPPTRVLPPGSAHPGPRPRTSTPTRPGADPARAPRRTRLAAEADRRPGDHGSSDLCNNPRFFFGPPHWRATKLCGGEIRWRATRPRCA